MRQAKFAICSLICNKYLDFKKSIVKKSQQIMKTIFTQLLLVVLKCVIYFCPSLFRFCSFFIDFIVICKSSITLITYEIMSSWIPKITPSIFIVVFASLAQSEFALRNINILWFSFRFLFNFFYFCAFLTSLAPGQVFDFQLRHSASRKWGNQRWEDGR